MSSTTIPANKSEQPKKIYLKDYQAPDFKVDSLDLSFDLHEDYTQVQSQMKIQRTNSKQKDLILDGIDLELISVSINNQVLKANSYQLTDKSLTLFDVPDQFDLKTVVKIKPQLNTSLEGLYKSKGIFCTQCESEGFRHITYFLDRPDVMTTYTVHIEADQRAYPVLLSNGDRIQQKVLENGRHQVTWKDPFKKPSYLFALVAGDLGVIKDQFTTSSGKKVALEIYASHGLQSRCTHAMESLKKSMKWDEDRFGREYDLSTYMIVAIDDFNAGAMENKGLNLFNSRLVLADPKTATDLNYFSIESVVGHEYFHNWTGNRVTLRDWFHLSLKEGLTVFRDQEFSMDLHSRPMIRIDNVNDLRSRQFSEDSGPNAHPIRPESCFSVSNFYTSTIYEKGSEIIRMMQTMVGRPGFRKGMDLYFERHDGQAVIIEDFAKAISDANNQNWDQFKLWYSQAGTPHVKVTENYDSAQKVYSLTLEQSCAPTPDQPVKLPFHIPLIVGLLGSDGKDMTLNCPDVVTNSEGQTLLHLKESKKTYTFTGVSTRPVLSLNRSFSAPIHLDWNNSDENLLFLMKSDSDAFNRWESNQKLSIKAFHQLIEQSKQNQVLQKPASLISAYANVLQDNHLDNNMKASLFTLPDDSYLSQLEKVLDVKAFLQAREFLEKTIGQEYKTQLLEVYNRLHGKNVHGITPADFANRRWKNTALAYLSQTADGPALAFKQFSTAENMTDEYAGLTILSHLNSDYRPRAFEDFHKKWKNESLVLNSWFSAQASSTHPDAFETVVRLSQHPDFDIKNPNRVYSLFLRFGDNLVRFHDSSKDTYSFMADKLIELDKLNPQVAARVAGCFDVWPKLPVASQAKVQAQLQRLLRASLSSNTYEIISRAANAKPEVL